MDIESNEQPAHICKESHPYLRFAFYAETLPGEWYLLAWDETGHKYTSIPAMWCMFCGVKLKDGESNARDKSQ